MSQVKIAAIVEGHGECEAVPILIRRIAQTIDSGFVPNVFPPVRVPASRLLKPGELERAVELAARKLKGNGGILVLLDCDWKQCCPAQDIPELLHRAQAVRPDMLVSVILAKQEFEAWFIAAAESLRGKKGFPIDLSTPENPEGIRDAKGWLNRHLPWRQQYVQTTDQAAFTAIFDLELASQSDSFHKCFRDVRGMLVALKNQ